MSKHRLAKISLKTRVDRITTKSLVEIFQYLSQNGWIVSGNGIQSTNPLSFKIDEYLLILTEIGVLKRFDVPNTSNYIHYLSEYGHRMLINLPAKKASELTTKDYYKVIKKYLKLN